LYPTLKFSHLFTRVASDFYARVVYGELLWSTEKVKWTLLTDGDPPSLIQGTKPWAFSSGVQDFHLQDQLRWRLSHRGEFGRRSEAVANVGCWERLMPQKRASLLCERRGRGAPLLMDQGIAVSPPWSKHTHTHTGMHASSVGGTSTRWQTACFLHTRRNTGPRRHPSTSSPKGHDRAPLLSSTWHSHIQARV